MAILIEDPADPRIAAFRDIKERDLVGRQGRFIAEGQVVLNVLVASEEFRPVAILIAQKRIEALAPLLSQATSDTPVYAAGQGVLDAIAGFPLHRGVLALAERRTHRSASELIAALPDEAVVVALFGIANHDNMGGIFRNAAAFGANAVLLDDACCDPLYRKAIRVSVGGALKVPFARFDGADPIAMLRDAGFEVVALSPAGGATLASYRRGRRVATLFGAEGPGLSEDLLAQARTVRIPMAGGFDSLNVATTSGIVLAHLSA